MKPPNHVLDVYNIQGIQSLLNKGKVDKRFYICLSDCKVVYYTQYKKEQGGHHATDYRNSPKI